MEERNELIKELFELHKLLADKGEISIGYGFSENYERLQAKVKKLTIPIVSVAQRTFCRHYESECIGDLCSLTPNPEECTHLWKQNAH